MPPLVQQLQDITDESPPGDLDRRLAKECIMGRMDGKVAIISGGARGMGAEEVRLFAREGAKVVFGDVLDELGQQVEVDCRAEGLDVAYTHLDVTSEGDWQAIVALAEDRYGKLDTLVNNAGISISVEGGARNISLEDTSVEAVGPRDGHQLQGRVPGYAGSDSGDATGRRRVDHQHLFHRGDDRSLVPLPSV